MKKIRNFIPWLAVSILYLLGLGCFAVRGYRFSGCVCFAVAAVIVCYRLLHFLSRRKPKLALRLQTILTICLCLFLLAYAVTGAIIIGAPQNNPAEVCSSLIVLGAGVNGTEPSLSLRERLDAAAAYLQAHPKAICVVSGGQGSGEDITEAECMYRYLVAAGIEPERIIKEELATSTQENLRYSMELIPPEKRQHVGIVSSEYHLFRARLMARDQGFEPIVIPAKTTRLSLRMNYYMREVAAVWYYLLLGGQHHDFSFLCGPLLGAGSCPSFH